MAPNTTAYGNNQGITVMLSREEFTTLWKGETIMAFTPKDAGVIRSLIYPVQFESSPLSAVDRVLSRVIGAGQDRLSASACIESITGALESDDELSKLIPQDHSEETIRSYLKEILSRLKK